MYMDISDARGIFGNIQEDICHSHGRKFVLTDSVHSALNNFHVMVKDVTAYPTHLQDMILLPPNIA